MQAPPTPNGHGAGRYVKQLPPGLRSALASGRWLPLIGAGLSTNAATVDGRRPPTWRGLGEAFGTDAGASVTDPVDALSAFQAAYDRAYLVNRLAELLLIDEVVPGDTHRAFAQLPFDMVVTTNVDFLLELAYREERRPCVPLVGESQLTMSRRPEATYLLKFHGDIYHPNEMVITEDDYDGFLQHRPILTTYLSSLFLNRDPVLIGYSLDDPDLREILALLRERLGRMARAIWAILPSDPNHEEAKFQRRGLKPVVLDRNPEADRAQVLTTFFRELRSDWERTVVLRVRARSDSTTAELRRHSDVSPQLALVVASRSMLSLYRDFVFPSVPQSGLIPLGMDDIQSPDSTTAPMAIDIALSKAAVVVYDTGQGNPLPLEYVAARRRAKPMVLVSPPEDRHEIVLAPPGAEPLACPVEMSAWPQGFVEPLVSALRDAQPLTSLPTDLANLRTPPPPAPGVAQEVAPDLGAQLSALRNAEDWDELLLTTLALLEAELRGTEAPQVGVTSVPTTGGRMSRLSEYFGIDFGTILEGVRARHDLLQGLRGDGTSIQALATQLDDIVRRRRALAPGPDLPAAG